MKRIVYDDGYHGRPYAPWELRALRRTIVGYYPWHMAVLPTAVRERIYGALIVLGFWDMDDGDYYVRGHWNWRCWQTWERNLARYGITTPLPWFPRTMKRIFAGA